MAEITQSTPLPVAAPPKKGPRGEVIIFATWCKGCHICVEFCPTKVLEMKGFVAAVKNLEACIKCMQCELRCPDFAIKVTP